MAIRDHTAPARLHFPSGDASASPLTSVRLTASRQASSLHLSTLDDITVALFALSCLLEYSECSRRAAARFSPEGLVVWPLSPLFVEGLTSAVQCLRQYAGSLGLELKASV
ncbi:hypothetical protein [Dyella telluris]|uniref:Uncharacterized protein n=1 Tax=Dyella telluris TaxID=2763498 RepID=A0A7G8Q8Q6_9GAMM|nr:hypothetical protein [Dyella telluris]QNK03164.1 hypothetical protein H8F01_08670 [Dyella telluris]